MKLRPKIILWLIGTTAVLTSCEHIRPSTNGSNIMDRLVDTIDIRQLTSPDVMIIGTYDSLIRQLGKPTSMHRINVPYCYENGREISSLALDTTIELLYFYTPHIHAIEYIHYKDSVQLHYIYFSEMKNVNIYAKDFAFHYRIPMSRVILKYVSNLEHVRKIDGKEGCIAHGCCDSENNLDYIVGTEGAEFFFTDFNHLCYLLLDFHWGILSDHYLPMPDSLANKTKGSMSK